MDQEQTNGRAATRTQVSIVVPTYKEAKNIPALVEGVHRMANDAGFDVELIIVDDNSNDGTEQAVEVMGHDWVRLEVRKNERGLSTAVLRGLDLASHGTLVVMDADMSHPPSAVASMVESLESGSEFVIASRFVEGGSTADDWGAFRQLNAAVAKWLSRPLANLTDPMSGFFAFRRPLLERAATLNPIGYKIGLELLVKSRVPRDRVGEVPIHFSQRQAGESKLSFKQQLLYLEHLRRLMWFKSPAMLIALVAVALLLCGTALGLVAWLIASMT